jgi:hypothetical protein
LSRGLSWLLAVTLGGSKLNGLHAPTDLAASEALAEANESPNESLGKSTVKK